MVLHIFILYCAPLASLLKRSVPGDPMIPYPCIVLNLCSLGLIVKEVSTDDYLPVFHLHTLGLSVGEVNTGA